MNQPYLQVYTHQQFPIDWAMTQYNRGNAYACLHGENQKTNLERAIACFYASLHIFNTLRMDFHAQVVMGAIKKAQERLQA